MPPDHRRSGPPGAIGAGPAARPPIGDIMGPHPERRQETGGFWRQGNLAILAWFLALLAADLLVQGAVFAVSNSLFLPIAAASLLGVVLPLLLLARSSGGTLGSEFDLGRTEPGAVLWSVVAALGALVPTSFLADQSLRLHPIDPEWLDFYVGRLPATPGAVALAAFTAVVLAPVAEELLFRGLLQRLTRRLWGPVPAILVSALVFGMVHGEPWYLFGLIALGLLLAWVYETTGSLTPCIALHATHNAVSFLLLLLNADLASGAAAVDLDLWLLAISLAALVLAGTRLARYGP